MIGTKVYAFMQLSTVYDERQKTLNKAVLSSFRPMQQSMNERRIIIIFLLYIIYLLYYHHCVCFVELGNGFDASERLIGSDRGLGVETRRVFVVPIDEDLS